MRKIIHIDMDAFFASVEQRDTPALRGKPLAVGYGRERGVVAAASYEARKFGVHSAMPSVTALRKCPELIFAAPRFEVYRAVSQQIHAIFAQFTPIIEPLSLDEAYLDVTDHLAEGMTATETAQAIRALIREKTGLTASAGVSYNKFLAKLASGQNKPDGQFVITPKQGPDFVENLPVSKFHGVGPATAAKMRSLGIETGRDLKACPAESLKIHFGKASHYYYAIARGVDERPVRPDRERKSIGAEKTFLEDLVTLEAAEAMLLPIVDKCVAALRNRPAVRTQRDAEGKICRFPDRHPQPYRPCRSGVAGRTRTAGRGAACPAFSGAPRHPSARRHRLGIRVAARASRRSIELRIGRKIRRLR